MLWTRLASVMTAHASRPALECGGQTLAYADLLRGAGAIAGALLEAAPAEPVVIVYARRSPTAYLGVLGTLAAGKAYSPINPESSLTRNRLQLERSGSRTLVVDAAALATLPALLEGMPGPITVVLPDDVDAAALRAAAPTVKVIDRAALAASAAPPDPQVPGDAMAYLLFTSGSTGVPKGVAVSHANVVRMIDAFVERVPIAPDDRFSQTFEATFDLSVFDMFVCWTQGACLVPPTPSHELALDRYIRDGRLTVWFSVPSLGNLMQRGRMLKPDALPGLRLSLFCGEALTVALAEAWARAAPASIVENLYGPTEATVFCSWYRWDRERGPADAHQGVVPIGEPNRGTELRVLDEALAPVPVGQAGELYLGGDQLAIGYWLDPAQTDRAFVRLPSGERFYRTGDLAMVAREGGPVLYLGRTDSQIKLRGYRVELGEIEAVVRAVSGADTAVAIGWPVTEAGADGVVCFVVGTTMPTDALRAAVAARLPPYMVPREFRAVTTVPTNPSGKVDRRALREQLAGRR